MELNEFRAFCKDTRCSQRALSKLSAIFQTANQHAKAHSGARPTRSQEGAAEGLLLAEFMECIVRVAREQIPGKDYLPKKLQMFLLNVARHSKVCLFACVCMCVRILCSQGADP